MTGRVATGSESSFNPAVLFAVAAVAGGFAALLPLLPLILQQLTGTTAESGVITGAVGTGALVVGLTAARLLSALHVQRSLAIGLLAMSGALVVLSKIMFLAGMVVCGAVFGSGFGLAITSDTVLMSSTETARGRALGTYGLAVGIPATAEPPLALDARVKATE